MNRQVCLFLFIIGLSLFVQSCSDEQEDEYFENVEFTGVNNLAPDYIKAFQDALTKVIREVYKDFPLEQIYINKWATYEYDNDIPALVMLRYEAKNRFLFNAERLLEEGFTLDKGMLLIALHELFHMKLGRETSNDEGHKVMLESRKYHKWIKKYIGCRTLAEARTLAYIGMEGTPEYQKLSDEGGKEYVDYLAEVYEIKEKINENN